MCSLVGFISLVIIFREPSTGWLNLQSTQQPLCHLLRLHPIQWRNAPSVTQAVESFFSLTSNDLHHFASTILRRSSAVFEQWQQVNGRHQLSCCDAFADANLTIQHPDDVASDGIKLVQVRLKTTGPVRNFHCIELHQFCTKLSDS